MRCCHRNLNLLVIDRVLQSKTGPLGVGGRGRALAARAKAKSTGGR